MPDFDTVLTVPPKHLRRQWTAYQICRGVLPTKRIDPVEQVSYSFDSLQFLLNQVPFTMPKAASHKRNATNGSPYARPTAKAKTAHNIFKMNTDLGSAKFFQRRRFQTDISQANTSSRTQASPMPLSPKPSSSKPTLSSKSVPEPATSQLASSKPPANASPWKWTRAWPPN